ncbi:MAG: HNH endonuclease [Candidatus Saccharimonadales bacterium]
MNEKDRVRAWRQANRKPCPDGCGVEVAWDTIACRKCQALRKREKALDRTVAEVKAENKSKRWTDHIRYFARSMHIFDSCDVCGYDKHVEVAHIVDVASFPDSATIREINSRENVRGLCPNHHWELDNGVLKG